MLVHARLCEAMSGVAHNCADFGNERKKLGVSAKPSADIDSEVRTLKRGVARCGFDNDITAYADIDIKSLSPGRVLRTPLDPSGQAAQARAPNPTMMRRIRAPTTYTREGNAQPHGLHPTDG